MELLQPKPTNLVQVRPKLNDVILCGGCGFPNVIELTGTHLMTEDEFGALHPDERKELDFAQRAIKRQLRNN